MMRERSLFRIKRNPGTVLITALVAAFVILLWSGFFADAGAESPVPSGIGAFAVEASNPAVIGMGEPVFRLRLAPFTATVQNNTWPLATFDYWLDKEIPENIRKQFVDNMPEQGLGIGFNSHHGVLLGVGRLSAGVGIRTLGNVTIAQDAMRLLFLGNELNTPYTLDSFGGGVAFGDASVAYSLPVTPSVRVGLRYHKLLAAVYADAHIDATAEIVHTDEKIGATGDVALRYTLMGSGGKTGTGSAFDIGANVQLSDRVSVGVAALDIGRIQWPEIVRRECNMSAEDDLDVDPDGAGSNCSETADKFVWNLPQRYEISAGWQLPWPFHLGATYTLTRHSPGNVFAGTSRGELGTMLVWNRFKFAQLGVGATLAGAADMSVQAGAALRLGPLQTRAHISNLQVLFGKGTARAFGLGVDLGLVF